MFFILIFILTVVATIHSIMLKYIILMCVYVLVHRIINLLRVWNFVTFVNAVASR